MVESVLVVSVHDENEKSAIVLCFSVGTVTVFYVEQGFNKHVNSIKVVAWSLQGTWVIFG